jgi:hypothetical protein
VRDLGRDMDSSDQLGVPMTNDVMISTLRAQYDEQVDCNWNLRKEIERLRTALTKIEHTAINFGVLDSLPKIALLAGNALGSSVEPTERRCDVCGETKIHGPKCGYGGSPV